MSRIPRDDEPDWVREGPKRSGNVQCSWKKIHGPQCPLMASWFPNGGESDGVCSWHAVTQRDVHTNAFEEFERFCAALWRARYCTVWTHHGPGTLWGYMDGRAPLSAPEKCLNAGCPHQWPEWNQRDVCFCGKTADEHRREFHALRDTLVTKLTTAQEEWRTTPSLLERMGIHPLRPSVRRAMKLADTEPDPTPAEWAEHERKKRDALRKLGA